MIGRWPRILYYGSDLATSYNRRRFILVHAPLSPPSLKQLMAAIAILACDCQETVCERARDNLQYVATYIAPIG